MRNALLLVSLIIVSQSALATGHFVKFSRPNTPYGTFMDDRTACLKDVAEYGRAAGASMVKEVCTYEEFVGCMTTKSYKLDPHGYRAIWYLGFDGRCDSWEPDHFGKTRYSGR